MSDLYGAQQGHADLWQICLAHQLRECTFAIEAGDTVFAPRMKRLLLRTVVLARRRKTLAERTCRAYLRQLDHELNAILALAPTNRDGRRLRKRYGKVPSYLFTFLEHPDAPPDNTGSEREFRPISTYRKVTGGFLSHWGADLFAALRSVIGTAARLGIDAYHAIRAVPRREVGNSTGLSNYLKYAFLGGATRDYGRYNVGLHRSCLVVRPPWRLQR